MGIIYKLTFASGKSYIGQTVRTMNTRMTAHRNVANSGSLLAVHCAWREHGEPNVEILATTDDQEQLHKLEIALIAEHKTISPNGYNISEGGDTAPSKSPEVAAKIAAKALGRKWSEEKKLQMAEAMRKKWEDPEYRKAVISGVNKSNLSQEVAEKRSISARSAWDKKKADGWKYPESAREKLKGRVFSDETKARMSSSAKGKIISVETRKKIGAASRGATRGPYNDERKSAISEGIKAAWVDPEKRERLTEARKRAWETRRANKEKDE